MTKKHVEALTNKHQAVLKLNQDYQTRRAYIKQQLDKALQDQEKENLLFQHKVLYFQQKLNQQGQEIKVLTTENAQLFSQVKDLKT